MTIGVQRSQFDDRPLWILNLNHLFRPMTSLSQSLTEWTSTWKNYDIWMIGKLIIPPFWYVRSLSDTLSVAATVSDSNSSMSFRHRHLRLRQCFYIFTLKRWKAKYKGCFGDIWEVLVAAWSVVYVACSVPCVVLVSPVGEWLSATSLCTLCEFALTCSTSLM